MAKIQSLAYVVAEATDTAKWKQYGEEILGMSTSAADGGLALKMDERHGRIHVIKGEADKYHASGWELPDEKSFNDAIATLKNAGVETSNGSDAERKLRGMKGLAVFKDPAGNRHELCYGYEGKTAPFKSPIGVSGFLTGKYGMGHTVLPAMPFDETLKLFKDVLGFGLSDIFNFKPAPDAPNMRIYFMHAASGRHHSLALAEMPNPAGCVHIMVEVTEKEEVDRAEKRQQQHGVKLMATMGQHENDKMTSFYMMTPGNFALEYGWGGLIVDPDKWQTTETQRVSIWGHDFSVGFQ